MKLLRIILILCAVIAVIGAFTSCGKDTTTPPASTTPPDMIEPSYSYDMTVELLEAINNQDYDTFIKNLDGPMLQSFPVEGFSELCTVITGTIGTYTSITFNHVEEIDNVTRVIYAARFTDEPSDVAVGLSFTDAGDRILISGLWFNSPKLRGE